MWPARENSPVTALSPSMRLTFGRLNRARWRSVAGQKMRQVCAHMDLWFQVSAFNSSLYKPRNIGPKSNRHASSIIVRESLAQLDLVPLRSEANGLGKVRQGEDKSHGDFSTRRKASPQRDAGRSGQARTGVLRAPAGHGRP